MKEFALATWDRAKWGEGGAGEEGGSGIGAQSVRKTVCSFGLWIVHM